MADEAAVAFRRIGEWHVPNRVIYAQRNKIPPSELWTYIPTRCHWCKRERKLGELEMNSAFHLRCANHRDCEKARTGKEPETPDTPQALAPTKKVVIRRK